MDRNARQALMDEIAKQRNNEGDEIAVSLDLFFTGNDDKGSIGCNLGNEQPEISDFYRTLSALRSKPEVQDILVRITDSGDEESWPYSDTVYVIASLSQEGIESALSSLMFDEIVPGWMYGKPANAAEPQGGFNAYSLWWD